MKLTFEISLLIPVFGKIILLNIWFIKSYLAEIQYKHPVTSSLYCQKQTGTKGPSYSEKQKKNKMKHHGIILILWDQQGKQRGEMLNEFFLFFFLMLFWKSQTTLKIRPNILTSHDWWDKTMVLPVLRRSKDSDYKWWTELLYRVEWSSGTSTNNSFTTQRTSKKNGRSKKYFLWWTTLSYSGLFY